MIALVGVRAIPLIHDKTVDEWGTKVCGYLMTGPPAKPERREPGVSTPGRTVKEIKNNQRDEVALNSSI
jgi:hypothetical protein